MLLNDYQSSALTTAVYPQDQAVVYNTIALAGEVGELANKVKKIMRGDKELNDEVVIELVNEIGDALWYIANLADALGFSLDAVAQLNLAKLADRKKRGVLKGDGDTR